MPSRRAPLSPALVSLLLVACGSEESQTTSEIGQNTGGKSQGGAGQTASGASGAKAGGNAGAPQAGAGQAGQGGVAGAGQGGVAGAGQGGVAGAGQAGAGQAGAGQAGAGQASAGQAGSGQGGAGQAGSGETSCADGVKNGDESDVDCGGSCAPCFKPCLCASDADCPPEGLCIDCQCWLQAPIDEARVHKFNGSSDAVVFGPARRLEFGQGETISVSVWVKPASLDGYDTIVARPQPCANAGNYALDLNGGVPRFCYRDATGTKDHCTYLGQKPLVVGQWTHLAFSFTFGQGSSFKGYINGNPSKDTPWALGDGNDAPWQSPTAATEAGHFAGCASGKEYFFEGEMYQLAVYDRALAAGEVTDHFLRVAKLPCADKQHRALPVTLTLLDGDATGYATFQSHNQKVVASQHGIFTTHVRTRNEPFTAQQWRLSRSTDGGKIFSTVYEETAGTNPPAIEVDAHGNLYLMKQRYESPPDSTLYVFKPEDGFASHQEFTIPDGNSGKYAMLYDWRKDRLYYFSHEGRFYAISPGGQVLSQQLLIKVGPSAGPQYPLLSMDENGVVYAAWTTLHHDGNFNYDYLYWSIGTARSRDGGASWERFDQSPLSLPIVCDETGGAHQIQLGDELNAHTWLWNLSARQDKVHYAYLAQTDPPRQHYVRLDAKTGARDVDLQPAFKGSATGLRSLDGFVAADPGMPSRLFWISAADDGSGKITALQSTTSGASWLDFARSAQGGMNLYALGGARFVADDGAIIGTVTDFNPDPAAKGEHSKVYFFRIETRSPADPVGCH